MNLDIDKAASAQSHIQLKSNKNISNWKLITKAEKNVFLGKKLPDIDAILRQVRKQAWNTPKSHHSYNFWR